MRNQNKESKVTDLLATSVFGKVRGSWRPLEALAQGTRHMHTAFIEVRVGSCCLYKLAHEVTARALLSWFLLGPGGGGGLAISSD